MVLQSKLKDKTNMMKCVSASSYLKLFLALFVIGIIVFSLFFKLGYTKFLIISHQETEEVYIKTMVKTGDPLVYKWIHSFENIPWFEEYTILDNNSLQLKEIKVAGFGAGIPENKGRVEIKDGMIIMSDLDQEFKEINWINSKTALEYISLNGKEIIKGGELPHHEPINLVVKEMLSIWER